jgi:hypothetical protein
VPLGDLLSWLSRVSKIALPNYFRRLIVHLSFFVNHSFLKFENYRWLWWEFNRFIKLLNSSSKIFRFKSLRISILWISSYLGIPIIRYNIHSSVQLHTKLKTNTTTMSDNTSVSSSDDNDCPLCMEALEVDDLYFFPCTCQYQVNIEFSWIFNDYAGSNGDFTPLCRYAVFAGIVSGPMRMVCVQLAVSLIRKILPISNRCLRKSRFQSLLSPSLIFNPSHFPYEGSKRSKLRRRSEKICGSDALPTIANIWLVFEWCKGT